MSQALSCSAGNHGAVNNKEAVLPWLVWLCELSTDLRTKGFPVQFPIRAHAWVAGQVPSRGHARGNHTLMLLSLSPSLPLYLKINKISYILKKEAVLQKWAAIFLPVPPVSGTQTKGEESVTSSSLYWIVLYYLRIRYMYSVFINNDFCCSFKISAEKINSSSGGTWNGIPQPVTSALRVLAAGEDVCRSYPQGHITCLFIFRTALFFLHPVR